MEDPVVPLERNLYGHPLARLLWERQFEKVLVEHGRETVPNWECLFVNKEKGLFLTVYVEDIKLAGKKQNLDPMWKLLNKEVDLGEPTSFLDHENLGCTLDVPVLGSDTMPPQHIVKQMSFLHSCSFCPTMIWPVSINLPSSFVCVKQVLQECLCN